METRAKIAPHIEQFSNFNHGLDSHSLVSMVTTGANDLHLVPLGAGDLIDRAVRLYRRHLLTLLRIAAPPVVVSAIGWVMWTVGVREVANTADTAALVFYVLLKYKINPPENNYLN